MKAMRYHDFGGPELLHEDELPSPEPGPDEVVVKVAASSVNPADWKIGEGALRGIIEYPLPFIPGLDFSGIVTKLGSGVKEFTVGDRVFGAMPIDRSGAFAEDIAVPAAIVARAPQSIPLTTAAAVPLAALTAWHATLSPDYGNVQAGQKVLIHGGSGGTGIFAVQFARWRGAHVIATASARNQDFLFSLGAAETIDYGATPFEEVAGMVDVVIDLVGGDVQARSCPLIRKGGILTSIVSPPDQALAERYDIKTSFVTMPRQRSALTDIAALIDTGDVKVVISEEFPLHDAAVALTKSRESHVRGKLLLIVGNAVD